MAESSLAVDVSSQQTCGPLLDACEAAKVEADAVIRRLAAASRRSLVIEVFIWNSPNNLVAACGASS